jgi:hypothetical protein
MLSTARKSLCPSRICREDNPAQVLVSKRQAEAVDEPSLDGAILCSGCGCVWVRDARGIAHVLGTLRRSGANYRWDSRYKS